MLTFLFSLGIIFGWWPIEELGGLCHLDYAKIGHLADSTGVLVE
jgi:hypothetical protein